MASLRSAGMFMYKQILIANFAVYHIHSLFCEACQLGFNFKSRYEAHRQTSKHKLRVKIASIANDAYGDWSEALRTDTESVQGYTPTDGLCLNSDESLMDDEDALNSEGSTSAENTTRDNIKGDLAHGDVSHINPILSLRPLYGFTLIPACIIP